MTCPHDLIERETAVTADGYCPLCLAAEIARLRARDIDHYTANIVELEADNERLRAENAALRTILANTPDPHEVEHMRRALETKS